VNITGRGNVESNKAYIMTCNHQSLLDIPLIYRTFFHFKWVAKASLFKLPIIGWNMSLCNHVKIERGNKISQRKMFKQCAKHIRKGSSVLFFPEGTRSRSGELRPFKEGAFLIALQEKTDIVPMVIDNSYNALPKKGFFPRRKQTLKLNILPPVSYETFKDKSVHELSEHIHSIIAAELELMRKQ